MDAAVIGMVGYVVDGQPLVTPTSVWRQGDRLYFHGSVASGMLNVVEAGEPICVSAFVMDGFVLARTGFNHSVNYQSVLVLGRASVVSEPSQKLDSLRAFVERLFPGRWDELRPPTAAELKATEVLWLPIEEASAKIRAGGPHDNPTDVSWPVWAGVIPVRLVQGTPLPEGGLGSDLAPPTLRFGGGGDS